MESINALAGNKEYWSDSKELLQRKQEADQFNYETFVKDKEKGRMPKQALGMEDFLTLLTKQLAYQDPMAPMEDKEFIAQMAQFSSLKQMDAMSQGISKLSGDFSRIADLLSGSEAASALGRSVELADGEATVQGVVRAVTRGTDPQIMVNGTYYSWSQVTKVFEE
ncbi:MAG: flagellar hook assembly protein FlgD [Spirochaetaceae bacterium]|jgi:flagellar basal-body rod modification protein FlgD|nr:flagellar hook assembly protein FlgD [Spirochaetaceae bacterium]